MMPHVTLDMHTKQMGLATHAAPFYFVPLLFL